jgi:tetratricopeptide (TPR) repeat protein
MGNARHAIELLEKSLTQIRSAGNMRATCFCAINLGECCLQVGQHQRAIELFDEAITLSRRLGDKRVECSALACLGNAFATSSDLQRAISVYEEVLQILDSMGLPQLEATVLGDLGNVHQRQGNYGRSVELFRKQLAVYQDHDGPSGEAGARRNLADALIELAQHEEAVLESKHAISLCKQIHDELGECNALGTLGRAYRYSGAVTNAIEAHNQQLAME